MDKEFFKHRIASIRNAKNMSARNLSLELGMSSEYINQIECGRLKPSLDFIINFCDYFKLTVGDFFEQSNPHPTQLNSLITDLKKLNSDELNQISVFVKILTNKKG